MKNEEKIIELLAEYLQKTDQLIDQIKVNDQRADEQLKRIDIAYETILNHAGRFEKIDQRIEELR